MLTLYHGSHSWKLLAVSSSDNFQMSSFVKLVLTTSLRRDSHDRRHPLYLSDSPCYRHPETPVLKVH